MIVDGKQIAEKIREKIIRTLPSLPVVPTLAIVAVGMNPVTENYIRVKKKVGDLLDIPVIEHRFPETIHGDELRQAIRRIAEDKTVTGIVVQLPLPAHIDTQSILDAVPPAKDVDMISSKSVSAFARGDAVIFPPVAGAIQEILETYEVNVFGKEALVLGYGRLVGIPASIFLRHNHAHVTVIDRSVADIKTHTRESDIIVCGVGLPGLIRPEMLKNDVVLIDAGTSELGGKIAGDALPECAEHSRLFTPVPGGVGPIAISLIFKNLSILARRAYNG